MVYTCWDVQTNNPVAEFGTGDEALALVRRGFQRNGSPDTEMLTLEVEEQDGEFREVTRGQALADLARGEAHSSASPIPVP